MRAVRRRLSIAIRVVPGLLIASSILLACGPPIPRYKVVVSGSGTEWKMLSREPFQTEDGIEAIRFRYQSDLGLGDNRALRDEVTQFMEEQLPMLRRRGFGVVVVSATTGVKSGWSMSRDQISYNFERNDGGWGIAGVQRMNDVEEGRRVETH